MPKQTSSRTQNRFHNKTHQRNTVRYYVILLVLLSFLFFSGNFGSIDVQKTAIVMAVGIDREEDTFIVTSQIAIPQPSKQGNASQSVQIVSRGKTIADAFKEINAKTGWYPKLVFCRLILLGQKTAEQDVFEALDFFLLDEYMSDNCLIATCDKTAKELLNVTALVDSSGALAMEKVLSSHAERVGLVLPSTLRTFSIGYFSASKSAFLPVLKTQPQQEQAGNETGDATNNDPPTQTLPTASQSGSEQNGEQGGKTSGNGKSGEQGTQDKPVFSASETALFVAGKRVGVLTKEETFAVGAVFSKLKLASFSVDVDGAACTLSIKNNAVKQRLLIGKNGKSTLKISIKMTAGLLDFSKSLPLLQTKDGGSLPSGTFAAAQKRLLAQINTAFEKCKSCGCDLFGMQERLQKYQHRQYEQLKNQILKSATLDVKIKFSSIR